MTPCGPESEIPVRQRLVVDEVKVKNIIHPQGCVSVQDLDPDRILLVSFQQVFLVQIFLENRLASKSVILPEPGGRIFITSDTHVVQLKIVIGRELASPVYPDALCRGSPRRILSGFRALWTKSPPIMRLPLSAPASSLVSSNEPQSILRVDSDRSATYICREHSLLI